MASKNGNGGGKKKSSSKKKEVKEVDYQAMIDGEPSKVVQRQMRQEFKRKGFIE